ncbi:MAG: hypothetical protein II328_04530, partial [Clostridia bacterium]|nr:hypothetical protein [Clostridia bacterium]
MKKEVFTNKLGDKINNSSWQVKVKKAKSRPKPICLAALKKLRNSKGDRNQNNEGNNNVEN